MRHHIVNTLYVIGLALLLFTTPASGGCAVNCTGAVGSGMNCTAMFNTSFPNCGGYYLPAAPRFRLRQAPGPDTSCPSIGYARTITGAMRDAGATGSPGACEFSLTAVCRHPVVPSVLMFQYSTCVISEADGLPVELMEFLID